MLSRPRSALFAPFLTALALAACHSTPRDFAAEASPDDLRCEGRTRPLGLDVARPRFTWDTVRPGDGAPGEGSFGSWQLRLATSPEALYDSAECLWDSGKQQGLASGARLPADIQLPAAATLYWRVGFWGENDSWSRASDLAWFTTAPAASDWDAAAWISAPATAAADTADNGENAPVATPWLRRRLDLPAEPVDAVLHVASLGYHDVFINGREAYHDDDRSPGGRRRYDVVLAPNVSDLSQRVRVTSYDVTGMLDAGPNMLGLWLAAGWSRYPRYEVEGARPLVRAILDVTLADGNRRRITTDIDWQGRDSHRQLLGPWTFGNYGGERVDTAAAQPDWCTVESSDDGWLAATEQPCDLEIVAQQTVPNLPLREIAVEQVEQVEDGLQRVVFARSFTGQTSLRLRGEPGATIKLSWSERDDRRVTYGQRSELVLDAQGQGTFQHRFNYASARWVWIEGPVETVTPADVSGHLVRTAYEDAAQFATDAPQITRLRDAARHTFECLTLGGYVVDCAHRERWGYGGDAHATMELGLNEYDLSSFYTKWLDDWAAIQDEFGNLPFTAPTYRGGGGPAWSGIVVMLPWEIWRRTADRELLERSWPTIERWLAFLETKTEADILQFYFDERYTRDVYSFLGDWVPPGGAQAGGIPGPKRRFFNNAYYVWVVRTAAQVAAALGKDAEAERLAARADQLAAAVHAEFYDADNDRYVEDRQTYWLLPLLAGLGDEELRGRLRQRLLDDLDQKGHVDTGIHGTWFLTRWLLAQGRDGTAILHRLMTYPDEPGWQHMLDDGSGTLWEQWDGGNSRMHSSFLSVGAGFIEGFLGIRPIDGHPGYARCQIDPWLPPEASFVAGSKRTAAGTIGCHLRRTDAGLQLRVEIPRGTTAELRLPWEDGFRTVGAGAHEFAEGSAGEVSGLFDAATTTRLVTVAGSTDNPFE